MISFVYFDVGGVAILDFSGTNNWQSLKTELGITSAKNDRFETLWSEYDKRLCIDLSMPEVLADLTTKLSLSLPQNYDLLEGFVSRFQKNPSIWPAIAEISHSVPTGLLTNMYVDMFESIQQKKLLPPIQWECVVESAKCGLQKPNQAIYEYATKLAGVPRGEILFVDNTQRHLDGAADFGWQVLHYDPTDLPGSNTKLLHYFRDYL